MYEVGMVIEIIEMQGEQHYTGRQGQIKLIDDIGQLHGTWGGLAINPEVDKFIVLGYGFQIE